MKKALLLQIAATAAASMLVAGTADSIGAVNVAGGFRLNGHPAVANATLTSGAIVETEVAFGEIALAGGVHVVMASGAEAQLYRDRLILRRGAVQLAHAERYIVDAHGFRISLPEGNGSASVRLTPAGIEVSTVSGRARVVNAAGSTAWVLPGKPLHLDGTAAVVSQAPHSPKAIAAVGNGRRGPSPARPVPPGSVPSRPGRPDPPPQNSNPFPTKPFPFQPPLSP